MKILSILLNNLNSLRGEHCVDLTAEPLASAGLFAITGSTGSGKTTLLDAITLALYGKAARYGKLANPEHMMSRHCGECSAEVAFEVPSGAFRAVWQRHRSRNDPNGVLQPPKRYIYDGAGQSLTRGTKEAERMIEDLIGLDYSRFLRSALLAQGEFARFLKADPDDRAGLLESLTGTEIYSRLGTRAHEEAGRREQDLQMLEMKIGQIAILDDEKRTEIAEAIKKTNARRQELDKEIKIGSEKLTKIGSLEKERINEAQAFKEQSLLEEQKKDSKQNLEKLSRHQLSVPFTEKLADHKNSELALDSATNAREDADATESEAIEEFIEANFILHSSIEAELKEAETRADEARDIVEVQEEAASEACAWLKKHKKDAVLQEQITTLVKGISDLKNQRNTLSKEWSTWKAIASKVERGAGKRFADDIEKISTAGLQGLLDDFVEETTAHKKLIDKESSEAKKELDRSKDHLEKARQVAHFEEYLPELEDGEPCPLCGALDHPYSDDAPTASNLAKLENYVEKAEKNLERAKNEKNKLGEKIPELRTQRSGVLREFKKLVGLSKKLSEALKTCGEILPHPGKEVTLEKALEKRASAYRSQFKAEEKANSLKKEAAKEVKGAIKEAGLLEKKLEKLEPMSDEIEFEPLESKDLLEVSEAEEEHSVVEKEKNDAVKVASLRRMDEKSARDKLKKTERPLKAAIKKSEFKTLDVLRAARLDPAEVKKFEKLKKDLENREVQGKALLKQARQEIKKLLVEGVLENKKAEDFKTRQQKLRLERDEVLKHLATCQNQIKEDEKNRKRKKEQEKELVENREALKVWRHLKELIGSHNGKKFRLYAQAISLDILTRHANSHLQRLSDRYLICREKGVDLDLEIEDLHQAGTRRPMASLSGGESFLASLALALGLSDLAGRTVRIDSLFIDEGFGSLDQDTLEIAIDALESLLQQEKTIGVISHVPLLKERIATQIVVKKEAGGVSTIRVVSNC